jgi:hypothetical protein
MAGNGSMATLTLPTVRRESGGALIQPFVPIQSQEWLSPLTHDSLYWQRSQPGVYYLQGEGRRCQMPDDLRITVDELRKRMEAGEDFIVIDTRNPKAWAESDQKLPEAIRVPLDNLEQSLSKIPRDKSIVTYCT